jgi:hypothetical protein
MALLAEIHHPRWNPASNSAAVTPIFQSLTGHFGLANQVHVRKLE